MALLMAYIHPSIAKYAMERHLAADDDDGLGTEQNWLSEALL
jgi:hypothetical protein